MGKKKSTSQTARNERLCQSAQILRDVHRRLPILKTVRWSPAVRERFFARGAKELPKVTYRGFDPSEELAQLKEARQLCRQGDAAEAWLRRSADALETTATMLGAVGTKGFSTRAQKLYGTPTTPFPGTDYCVLDQARRLIRTTTRANRLLPDPPEPRLRAGEVADEIRAAVRDRFGRSAPEVEVVTGLPARASASASKIRIRRSARFSDLDVRQLIHHEAFVHVATALNGKRQRKLPILASSHAGTTRTQEGLAVVAELISGSLDPRRLLRLAHRVVAVHKALKGADFLEVYRYFVPHSQNETEAYESTARVFRGGLVTGGAAFPKDAVYLDGLCRVHVFLRVAVEVGRVDVLRLLFAGKFDLADIPGVAAAEQRGLCVPARFVPPWIEDPRRLVAYFAMTDVIGRAATSGLKRHFSEALEEPRVGSK